MGKYERYKLLYLLDNFFGEENASKGKCISTKKIVFTD